MIRIHDTRHYLHYSSDKKSWPQETTHEVPRGLLSLSLSLSFGWQFGRRGAAAICSMSGKMKAASGGEMIGRGKGYGGFGSRGAARGIDTIMGHRGFDESSAFMLDDDGRSENMSEKIIHTDFFNGACFLPLL